MSLRRDSFDVGKWMDADNAEIDRLVLPEQRRIRENPILRKTRDDWLRLVTHDAAPDAVLSLGRFAIHCESADVRVTMPIFDHGLPLGLVKDVRRFRAALEDGSVDALIEPGDPPSPRTPPTLTTETHSAIYGGRDRIKRAGLNPRATRIAVHICDNLFLDSEVRIDGNVVGFDTNHQCRIIDVEDDPQRSMQTELPL